MNALFQQAAIVVTVLATCFAGPVLAILILQKRKRSARQRRRSPIPKELLRGPGHSLRGQLDEAASESVFDVALLMVVPMVALALFLAQIPVIGLERALTMSPVFLIFALASVGYFLRKLWKSGEHVDKLRAGYDAELAVGQELDQLMRRGAAVFHDFPADGFNIDHVVISTNGVFAVETKGYTKLKDVPGRAGSTVMFDGKTLEFPTWTTSKPLEQAEHQAAWLAKWLTSATGTAVLAVPVVALPGWFVQRGGRGDVRVFNGKELAGLLESRNVTRLSIQDVQRIAHQVDQRCRTVEPRYNESERA